MPDDAPLGLFRGPHRSLSTPLSVDECVRRLRSDIGEPTLPLRARFGWYPLKRWPTISRKIRTREVLFITDTADRQHTWIFYSKITTHAASTHITGQYRVARALWAILALLVLYGVYLALGSLLEVPVLIIARRGGWKVISPALAAWLAIFPPLVLLTIAAGQGRFRRKKHAQEEQEILMAVKQLLEAEEMN